MRKQLSTPKTNTSHPMSWWQVSCFERAGVRWLTTFVSSRDFSASFWSIVKNFMTRRAKTNIVSEVALVLPADIRPRSPSLCPKCTTMFTFFRATFLPLYPRMQCVVADILALPAVVLFTFHPRHFSAVRPTLLACLVNTHTLRTTEPRWPITVTSKLFLTYLTSVFCHRSIISLFTVTR